MAHLHFLSGPLSGKRAHLKAPRISLGSAEGNSIRIDDPTIAPRHLVLVRDESEYCLYIDASRPPVAINGVQVVNETLRDGDRLQIGAVRATFSDRRVQTSEPEPLDFQANAPAPSATEVLSLDDAEELPLEDAPVRGNRAMRALLALGLLMLMLGGSLLFLQKERWREKPAAIANAERQNLPADERIDDQEVTPTEKADETPIRALPPLSIGAGESGLRPGGKILRTKAFKSHQEAVDAARPGDSVIFDSPDPKPVTVLKPLNDVQFISGSAAWEIHADVIDCQFILHEAKQFIQREGRLMRSVFYRCPMKQTHLIHADAVSFYFDERSPLHPKDNPEGGKSPILLLAGFVRNVLIMKPFSGSATADKRFDMHWGPSIRIHATDPAGDGRGTYILSPVVLGQRAWTPHEISRGNGVTYAHVTVDNNAWANPVLEILRGQDCVVLCTSLGSESATTTEQYAALPKLLKYHDHAEFGHDNGPAFRGAAMTIMGLRTRIVAHGDARKPWTVGRKSALPGLHYADGIVVNDPFIKQFATENGGLSLNLAEMKAVFIHQPTKSGGEALSHPQQPDGAPLYPVDGPEIHKPVFVPLKDLRINAGEFDKLSLVDLTGKKGPEIEKALAADKSIYLGPGVYELKQTVKSGFVVGAGMEKTTIKWPDGVDCCQRNCRGMINCTMMGGHFGFNSQSGAGGRVGNPNGLFLRTRFLGQKEAAVNLHASLFQTWQDCEFVGAKIGFSHGLDKNAGVFKGDKGALGGTTIDNLNLCNCTFRDIRYRAVELRPDSPRLGHVGIHNCLFEDVGDTAIHIEGGQTHLVQNCQLQFCARQSYSPAISIHSTGVVALSHLDIDCTGVHGNPACIALEGLAAVSSCSIRGMVASLKCDGLLAADRVNGDGNLVTVRDSLLCRCRFKNMDLPNGVAIAKEKDFLDVTARELPGQLLRTPPELVESQKVRTVKGHRRIEWKPIESPASGTAFYIVTSDEKELGRAPFEYEPPSDIHSPLFAGPPKLSFSDSNPENRNYNVLAVNGAGLMWDAREAPLRHIGPARAHFLSKDGDLVVIKEFPPLAKGKGQEIIDDEGKRHLISTLGSNGAPNVVYFELGDFVNPP